MLLTLLRHDPLTVMDYITPTFSLSSAVVPSLWWSVSPQSPHTPSPLSPHRDDMYHLSLQTRTNHSFHYLLFARNLVLSSSFLGDFHPGGKFTKLSTLTTLAFQEVTPGLKFLLVSLLAWMGEGAWESLGFLAYKMAISVPGPGLQELKEKMNENK